MICRDMTDTERVDWLRLIRTDNVGPVAFQRLLQRFGSVAAALDALPDLARSGGARRPQSICPTAVAEAELERTEACGGRIIALPEPDYPQLLREIPDPPPVITVFGNPWLLQTDCIGIVGARNASSNGLHMARSLAKDLRDKGLTVVSGLARGIDTAVHIGAGPNHTIAVVAGGADNIYPKENADLYAAIREHGVIVSEMPLGTTPQARHFPRRNRIVSGLCRAIVVVEATMRSGSLITARLAGEQGREVMAVPGFPSDSRAAGPNSLIKSGAQLIETAEDIFDTLHHLPEQPTLPGFFEDSPPAPIPTCLARPAQTSQSLEQKQQKLLDALGSAPVAMDSLLRECQISAAEGAVILLELELAGRIERQSGQMIARLTQTP